MTNKRRAVYAGSFDPVTLGHRSVVARAAAMFDHVICLVAVHPTKQPLFPAEKRVELLRQTLSDLGNVSADQFAGYTVNFARISDAGVLIRGVRGASDADYETRLAHLNHDLDPEITTVFVPADRGLADVSSSELKRMATEGQDLRRFCHPLVEQALAETTNLELIGRTST